MIRTSAILGDGQGQHERLTRDLIAGRTGGVLFTDMVRQPVHVEDLADALLEIAGLDCAGILHVTGPDAVSRYELGVLVAHKEGLDATRIPAGSIAAAGVALPRDVRLRTDRAVGLLTTRLRGAAEFMTA